MESQLQRPVHGQGFGEEEEPRYTGLHAGMEGENVGEYNQQGGKKSVLKKVKDKAKKIKDTLKKQTHGGAEPDHDESPEEEDDNDDEIQKDPEVHGTVIRSTNLPTRTDVNLEKPTDVREDRYDDPMVEDNRVRIPAYDEKVGTEQEKLPAMHQSAMQRDEDDPEPRVRIGPLTGVEEDPHSPKFGSGQIPPSNYQSKVADPTGYGGKEADVDPLISRFDDLKVREESYSKPDEERRDEFNPESDPKSFGSGKSEGMPRDSITGKISSTITDKAISAKNVVASKLGYGASVGREGSDSPSKPDTQTASPGFGSTITDRAISAKNVVASKLGYGAGDGREGSDSPSKPDTQTASPGFGSTITDRAISAKNAVASKLGYGAGGLNKESPDSPGKLDTSTASPGYVQKITETLTPVYEKVAGAGSTVISKVQGRGGAGDQGISDDTAEPKGSDKGVSMTEYLAEKFRPGDEDKALSEVITDAFHKKKEGLQKTGDGTGTGTPPPMGKVTESEEVATHLGSGVENKREGEDAFEAGRESSGPGVVSRVKDAVGQWMGKSTGMQTAQNAVSNSYTEGLGGEEAARGQQLKPQESGN